MTQQFESIKPGSVLDLAGIRAGDLLVAVDGVPVEDVLDFLYLTSEALFEMEIETPEGTRRQLTIERTYGDDLGATFVNPIMDDPKRCQNQCVFCFIDQLPTGLRESLYFKDDDSRLSFLQGNFVTLTNVTDRQLDKIIAYGISPINVSVHTTDPDLRRRMLGNKRAGKIMEQLQRLTQGGITVNAQIVLCPGLNDGEALTRTLEELATLGEHFASVAVVPLGKTKYRDHLAEIPDVDEEVARDTIERCHGTWPGNLEGRGSRLVFVADEFYLKAGADLPPAEAYEGFHLLEDGVGLLRWFAEGFEAQKAERDVLAGRYTLVTGMAAVDFLRKLVLPLTDVHPELELAILPVENQFFGTKITVSGLVVGEDIKRTLSRDEDHGTILIPKSMLRENSEMMLDNTTLDELRDYYQTKVQAVPVDPAALLSIFERNEANG